MKHLFGFRSQPVPCFVQEAIHLSNRLEKYPDAAGRIEVIVHSLAKLGPDVFVRIRNHVLRATQFGFHTVEKRINLVQIRPCFVNGFVREIDRAPVMAGKKKKANSFWMIRLNDIFDYQKIAEGFGHLFLVDVYKPVVYPIFCKGLSKRSL